jgi:hypothetical protein
MLLIYAYVRIHCILCSLNKIGKVQFVPEYVEFAHALLDAHSAVYE